MKWYRSKEMLNEILEQNKNELEKYKHDKIVALLKDENNLIKDHLELLDENSKLNKALDLACKMLGDWDCPVSQDLIYDLDCEACCDNYKECWKKYLMKKAE
jgi:hypothetical protein